MRGTTAMPLLVCSLALVFAGCGGNDGTIPPDDANNILNQVEAVQAAADEGNCDLAQDHAKELILAVNNLPNEVDPDVASELTKAATNLSELTTQPDQCTDTGASGVTGTQSSTTSTTEATTTSVPTTTQTTTTTTEPTTTEQTTQQGGGNTGQQPAGGGNQGESQPPSPNPTPTPGGGLEPPSGGVTPGGGKGGG